MIIVTGAKGLLGEAVCRRLKNILEVSRRTGYDLTDPQFTKKLPSRCDAIIHLAQSEQFRSFPAGAGDMFAVNTESTLRLAEYGLKSGCRTFIYASTGAIQEGSRSDNFYVNSKHAAELLLAPYAKEMAVTLLRYYFVYGERQRSDMLIPRLIHSVRQGLPLTLQGESGLSINPIYVEDAAEATVAALKLTGLHTLAVAGKEVISLRALGELIGKKLQRPVHFQQVAGTPSDLIGNIDQMTSLLIPPQWSLLQGIEKLCC